MQWLCQHETVLLFEQFPKERRPLLFLTANSGLAHSGPGGPGKAQQRNRGATPAQMHDRKGGSKASQRHLSRGFWDGAVRGCLLRSVAHFRVGSKVYPMRAVLNFWQSYSSNPLFFTRFSFAISQTLQFHARI